VLAFLLSHFHFSTCLEIDGGGKPERSAWRVNDGPDQKKAIFPDTLQMDFARLTTGYSYQQVVEIPVELALWSATRDSTYLQILGVDWGS